MAKITRQGFGQVEPNHLSAQYTGQIYAQLPAHIKKDDTDTVATIERLENGQYVKYDYPKGEINLTGDGEWMMVFNEVKLYDDRWRETYRHYAMQRKDFTDGQVVPRVIKTNVGDIYTTNAVGVPNTDGNTYIKEADAIDVAEGDMLKVDPATGFLVPGTDNNFQWQVVKVYTMPDGQPAVKLMRVK